jgi:DNA-binding IclR family transcriptional regulator
MSRYNKLKLRALTAFSVANGEWLSPSKVAERLDFVPRRSVWTYLKRLWRFGLLERRFSGRGTLQYRISDGGAARLRWLRSQGV